MWNRKRLNTLLVPIIGMAVSGTMAVTPPAAGESPSSATASGVTSSANSFWSSFEPGEPTATWTNTVEIDANGRAKAAGVDGSYSTGIPGNITDKVVGVTASAENTGGGEVKENLVDGDATTKWLAFASTGWVAFEFPEPQKVVHYALTSANDFPERDPKDWSLSGSADGTTWTQLDTRAGESFEERFQTKEYRFAGTDAYRFYRLDITANHSGGIVQLGDVQLSNGDTSPPPPSPMRSYVDAGPSSSPTAKSRAGFTGLHALQYSGSHVEKGRAYSYNKVFEVDIPVTRSTELSYLIFPRMTPTDQELRYPATRVAVDLAFEDGSYLSELGAKDQHGATVSPQGQGSSKTLSANQWNFKSSAIGRVAAGKRIKRILIAYDNPEGPAKFRGWVDDIRITSNSSAAVAGHRHPSDYVSTLRGTNSSGSFSRGNNIPATAVPHGFNFWTPMTDAGSIRWLYEYHRRNNADNLPTLQAFTVSHEPSPWMGDRQTFQVMPAAADSTEAVPTADRQMRSLAFKHANEVAKPHYYSVQFDNHLRTEIAPTDHAAMFRFTFPSNAGTLLFDNVNNSGGLTLDPAKGELTGYSDVLSGLSTGGTRLFVYATFDQPVKGSGKPSDIGDRTNTTGYLTFDTSQTKTVTMRIATSLLSVEQAKKNLALEIAEDDAFDTIKRRAQLKWDDKLGVIEVEGATHDQLVTLYSNLHRLFLYPNSAFENTGTASQPVYRYASPVSPKTGSDTPTETGAKVVDGKIYVNNGFWDTYRTTWPAYALFTPKQAAEMIDGFVQQYKDGGWVSRWSSPGYANLMTGTSSDVAFSDAYAKGIRQFDAGAAYEAALKNATVTPTTDNVGRKGLSTSVFAGYTSTATGEGFSWAMEGYLNDFGIYTMANALAEKSSGDRAKRYREEAEYFRNRALNYVNHFDKRIDFFQGRNPDGTWRWDPEEYDPGKWGYDYTETNGWNMAFTVVHDGRGLANLYGGKDKLAEKLDAFFRTAETGMNVGSYGGVIHEMTEARDVRLGQYGHSNQPSHHIPYMYNYAGRPDRTQAIVREAVSRLYLGSEIGQGYPGDEDNGEMSAWWVFSSLGFYPLQMGSENYAIGSPLFTKATIRLAGGKDLVITAPKNNARNVYVQGVEVNGKKWSKTYFPHEILARGGKIEFTMGPAPSDWATKPGSEPPSVTSDANVPKPLKDITGPGRGMPTASDGVDVQPLFDNDSSTGATLSGDKPWVQYHLDDAANASYYTVTSAATLGGDPAGWKLLGSRDGSRWTTIDERSDVAFEWRRQTRPFAIAKPGKFAYYRLEFTGSSPIRLTELEVLSR